MIPVSYNLRGRFRKSGDVRMTKPVAQVCLYHLPALQNVASMLVPFRLAFAMLSCHELWCPCVSCFRRRPGESSVANLAGKDVRKPLPQSLMQQHLRLVRNGLQTWHFTLFLACSTGLAAMALPETDSSPCFCLAVSL